MDSLILAVETLSDGVLIGCISLEDFRPDDGGGGTIANFGYWLCESAWGVGFATEAASAMLEHAFKSRGLSAIVSGHWAENSASARVQAKLGFRSVGTTMLQCVARQCDLEQVCTRLERDAWEAQKAAPRPPPTIIRGLLSEADLDAVKSYTRQLPFEDDGSGWTRYGDTHVARFLHHGGLMHDDCWRTFGQACPDVFGRLCARVRAAAEAAGLLGRAEEFDQLSVRCIEHHEYTVGGGLTDRGHCDAGSVLTLSVLLTEPRPDGGGVFSTTDSSGATTHHADLGRGDGIVLCSEMVHNVSPLKRGTRCSLVIEWWKGATNRNDRFS